MISRCNRGIGLWILSLLVMGAPSARSVTLIDGFDGIQQAAGGSTSQQLANVLGGERDLHSGFPNSSASIEDGRFSISAAVGDIEAEAWLIYDGIDLSPLRDIDGLGGIDLTAGGTQNAFSIVLESANVEFNIRIWIYSATTLGIYQSPSFDPAEFSSPETLIIPFTDFPVGTPITEAGLILVNFENDSQTTGLELVVSSISIIPEPTSALLIGMGLAGLAGTTHRKRLALGDSRG